MPVYLRNFYYKKLVEAKTKEKEEIDRSRKKSSIQKPQTPNIRR